jgi:two-component system, NarL family, invasion response regulator UvrY
LRLTLSENLETQLKRIIIADDHAVVRTGLQMILDETTDLCICGEASNGYELIEKLKTDNYDLVILDISMPGKDTIDVLKEIQATWAQLPVVILSMNPDEIYAVRMIRNGASAYINKETDPQQIITILRIVLSGKKYFTQQQSEMLAEWVIEPEKNANVLAHEALSDREFQIFSMLASGMKKSEIAEKLSISKNTIGNHRGNIMRKMNLATNSELTRYAIQHGIIK